MRLRTRMVGATTLALLGFVVTVHQWAQAPLDEVQALRASPPARHARASPGLAEPRPQRPLARAGAAPGAAPPVALAPSSAPHPTPSDASRAPPVGDGSGEQEQLAPPHEPEPAEDEAEGAQREPAELQRVAVEAGIPRADTIDVRTGAGLEVPSPVHDSHVARQREAQPAEALPAGELLPAEPVESAPVPEEAGPAEEPAEERERAPDAAAGGDT